MWIWIIIGVVALCAIEYFTGVFEHISKKISENRKNKNLAQQNAVAIKEGFKDYADKYIATKLKLNPHDFYTNLKDYNGDYFTFIYAQEKGYVNADEFKTALQNAIEEDNKLLNNLTIKCSECSKSWQQEISNKMMEYWHAEGEYDAHKLYCEVESVPDIEDAYPSHAVKICPLVYLDDIMQKHVKDLLLDMEFLRTIADIDTYNDEHSPIEIIPERLQRIYDKGDDYNRYWFEKLWQAICTGIEKYSREHYEEKFGETLEYRLKEFAL